MATSPLPYRGSPPLQSGGQNRKWPTSGQNGYLTPAISGIPTASERGAKSEVAHKWAKWLPHPCRIGDPHRFRAGGKIRSGPQVGKVATSPLPYRGSPPLQSRGTKSEVAHKWAKWLPHPCRIGDPHRCGAGDGIRSGPQVGKVATSPLPYRGSPPLHSGGQNQKWPTSGQSGYLTPAVSGIPDRFRAGGKIRSGPQVGKLATSPLPYRGSPTASQRGAKSEVAHKRAKWLPHPCRIGDPHRFRAGGQKSEVAHKWAKWLPHLYRIGDPHRFRAGGKIRSGPQVGKMATSPLPYRGSPPLQSGGQNQKWPTSGQSGYLTPAVSGIPTASERGAKSEVAHKWAKCLPHPCRIGDPHRFRAGGKIGSGPTSGQRWLPHPCRIEDPHRFRAGGKIRSGPQVGKMATSPLPYRGSPPLQSGGQNRKWRTKWGKMATSPLPYRGSPPLQSGGQNQKWPTSGQSGYLTPAVSGIPTASERGAKSEVAHKWAKWLPHPCRIGDPHRFRAGGKIRSGPQVRKVATSPLTASEQGAKIRSGPQVGKVATSPLPYRGSPPLQSGGQNQKWPTSGQSGYLTLAVSGIPTALERGAKSEDGPQVGKLATSPLPYRGSPPLQSGGQNQKWPTSAQSGYLTPAVSGIPTASERGAKSEVAHKWAKCLPHPCRIGIPTASERGAKSEVAHKWAKWLPHPCRIGDPHHFRAGGKIRSGPQVGKMATSPLPYRGSPPLQSGGQNRKWPTTPRSEAVGIPDTAGVR